MIKVNNQPVNFQTDPFENPYVDEIKYKQLVQQGDITQFQFQTIDDYNGQNVLANPSFGTSLNGWTQTNGKLYTWYDGTLQYNQTGSNRLASTVTQYVLTVGVKYEVKIKINQCFNGYFQIFLGTNKIAEKKGGTFIVSGICETKNNFSIQFIPVTGRRSIQSIGVIDYVICSPKSTNNHRFPIVDTEDSTTAYTLESINDYLNDPYTSTSDAQFIDSSLTMALDWQTKGIANGCYQIGVCDADINTNLQCGVRNSELFGGTNVDGVQTMPSWTLATGGSGSNLVTSTGIIMGGNGTATISQTGLGVGKTYEYKFNISTLNGTPTVNIYAGTDTDSYNTSGVKSGTLTCAGNTTFKIVVTGASANDYVVIEYIRCQAVQASLVADYYSNPFWLADTHHRTVVVNCNNTENVFGLNYETAIWSPRARLRGYIAPNDNAYMSTREHSETNAGRRDVYYFKRRKARLLIIENEPEFVHDWLSLLSGHDHAMVNNKEYFIEDDEYPPVDWGYFRVLGSTQIQISEKQQLERKVVTGEVKTAQFITDTDGAGTVGGFLTFNETNELVAINPRQDIILIDPSDPTIGVTTPPSTTNDEYTQSQ